MKTAIISTLLTVGLGASAWASTPLYIATDDSLVIDDFADGDMLSNQGGFWYAFSDVDDGGATSYELSIAAHTDENNNSFNALKLDFTLDKGGYMYSPWAEIQVKLGGDGSALNLSNCKEIRYDYRGGTGLGLVHTFRIVGDQTVYDVAYNYHSKTLYGMTANESGWQTASIKWSELKQAQWGEYDENGKPRLYIDGDLVKSDVEMFSWQVQQQSMPMGYGSSATPETFEIANLRCVNLPSYIVSFYQGDKLLQSKEYIKGETPYYDDDGLYVEGKYKYWIKGWNPKVTKVTGDAVYHAVMDSEVVKSKVVFYDYSERGFWFDEDDDGYILTSTEYEYGSVPAYTGINPVRLPTVDSSYTFKGWGTASCEWEEEEVCYGKDYCDTEERRICKITYHENLPAVGYDDVHYYPLFDATVNEYTVKFVDYDGKTVLKSVKLPYGASVSEIVPTENPTRASSGGLVYTFSGWQPAIDEYTVVNGKNDTYIATYTATNAEDEPVEMYTVTFMVESEIVQTGEYEYGDTPPTPENPTKASTEMYDYTFKDWYDVSCSNPSYPDWCEGGVDYVDGDKIYMALFDPQYRQYWVVFLDDDGSVIDSIQYEYGENIDYGITGYLNKKSEEDGFEFKGWNPELHVVKGRTEYQVVYNYRARFVVEGSVLDYDFYSVGEVPSFASWRGTPTKSPTTEYTYEFIGWDKEIQPVTDTVTYNALFKPVPIQKATEVIDIAEGEFKLIDDFEDDNDLSELETYWFVYNDNDSIKRVDVNGNRIHYASEIAKEIVDSENGKAIRVTYKRDTVDYDGFSYDVGWLGFGVALSKIEDNPVDISQCNVVQYDYKGSSHYFTVESKVGSVMEYVEGSKDWETNTIYPRDYSDDYYSVSVAPAVAFTQATYFIWSDMEGAGTLEIDNVKCLHKPTYTVQFYNGETLVDEAVYTEGEMPSYNGEIDTDDFTEGMEDEQFTYYFDGWTPEITTVTKDAVYRANIKKELRKYTICYRSEYYGGPNGWWSGGCRDVEYGEIPEYKGTVSLEKTSSCNKFEIQGWYSYDEESDERIDDFMPVVEDRSYTAVIACTDPVMYTVSFEDENGNAVGTPLEYAAGSWPNSADFPDVPEKEPTAECTWRGYWDTQWGGIYSDRTYTPQYYCYTRYYTVKLEIAGRDYSSDYVEYGTPYSDLDLSAPEEYWLNDGDVQYEFVEWVPSDENTEVKGDVTFTAKLNAKYAVRFVNYDDSPIYVNVDDEYYDKRFYAEGTPFSEIVKPADPTRADVYGESDTAITTYTFAGWLPVIGEEGITGPMTFRAAYKSSAGEYTVVFNISSYAIQEEFKIGSIPKFPYDVNIFGYADAQYTYTWKSWDREPVEVDGPAEYTAVFDSTLNKYEVAFYADDGVTPLEQDSRIYEYGTVIADPPTELAVAGKTGEYEMYGWCQAYYDDESKRFVRSWCGSEALSVTGETVYIPNIYYTIWFKDGNGETIDSDTYRYGANLEGTMEWLEEDYADEIVKNPTAKYEYTWNGKWDDESTVVTGSKVYTALFDSTKRKYEIAFVDEDDTPLKVKVGVDELESVEYEYDTDASNIVTPAEPQKPSTEALTYAFAGWVLDGKVGLNKVTGAATYKASYTSATRQYTITFVGDDDSPISSPKYPYMTKASDIVPPSAPDKSGFKFVGWKLVAEGGEGALGLNDVTGPAKYKAEYVEENKFVVTWVNEDGTKLCDEEYYIAGTTPEYKCPTPIKEPTAANTYVFSGKWSPAIGEVTGDITYTAVYTATTRKYTVTFENYDGSLLGTPTEYDYGTPAADIVLPDVPEREPTDTYVYTFAGWNVGDVQGDVTYRALFGSAPRMYNVTFREDGYASTYQYQYNTVVDLDDFWKAEDKEDEQCYYYFDKWVSQTGSNIVTGDMEYVPTYSECYKKSYVVTFFDPVNNIALSQTLYEYGTPASKIVAPTIDEFEVEGCTYTFDKWDTEIVEVKGNARYTAVYNEVCAGTPYVVTWVGADGKTITQQRYAKGDVPEYDGLTPSKLADEEFTYEFDSWSPEIVAVTEDATYTATFKPIRRSYTVTFVDYYGTEVAKSYPYGTGVEKIEQPTFEDVTEGACTYSFDGWNKTVVEVTANARYTATYLESCYESSSSEEPAVSSSSEEPAVSSSSEEPAVSSSSEEPAVSSSSEEPAVSSSSEEPAVSSSSEQPAVSSSSEEPVVSSSSEEPAESSSSEQPEESSSSQKQQYTVTWYNGDGSRITSDVVDEGVVPTYSGDTPTKKSTDKFEYTFDGWTPEVVAVTNNAEYMPVFIETIRKYSVTFLDGNGDTLSFAMYNYDTPETSIVKPTDPSKTGNTFTGWDSEIKKVTGNATYKATYEKNTYTVTYYNAKGKVWQKDEYKYGEKLVLRENSFTKEDVACTYAADGWTTTAPKTVTKNLSFEPKFGKCQVKSYVVTFIDMLGDTTISMEYLYGTKLSDIELPTLEDLEDGVCTLKFEGWDKELAEVTKALKLTAVYDSVCPDQSILDARGIAFKFGYANNAITVVQSSPAMVRVQLFDLNGQLVQSFNEQVVGSKSFSLSQLEKGSYLVRIESKSQARTARIVVK